LFGSYADGAPRPDGIPFFFYQKYWEVICEDLMNLFDAWFEVILDIFYTKLCYDYFDPYRE
jgi:hypothetical protein